MIVVLLVSMMQVQVLVMVSFHTSWTFLNIFTKLPTCLECGCDLEGTGGDVSCADSTGQCNCRDGWSGFTCDICASGYYYEAGDCLPCGCNTSGTSGGSSTCTAGDCDCLIGYTGLKCDLCISGFFHIGSTCQNCLCNIYGVYVENWDYGSGIHDGECEDETGDCGTCFPG